MGRNWAITIGINGYRNMQRLNYAKRDAEAVQSFLQQELNIQTVYHFSDDSPPIPQDYGSSLDSSPTYATLRRFFRIRFKEPFLRPGDNLWFFFAGHGKRHEERDYLMPIDADPGDESEKSTWIPLNFITERLRRSGADNVVMLIDACRSGSGRRDSSGFGQEKQQGVITLFACSPWESSYEIDELQHGAFTHALLQGLQSKGEVICATVEQLYQHLKQAVPKITQKYKRVQQTPYGVIEPPTKYHLILFPQKAVFTDINTLKLDAHRAELKQDFILARQLWIQVLAVSPVDHDAIEGIGRLALKTSTPDAGNQTEGTFPIGGVDRARSQRSSIEPMPRASFTFDIVKIDAQGEETERCQARMASQIETLGSGIILELVSIPGGSFTMGSLQGEKGRTKCERPQHKVKVQPFLIGRYPVTQAQWNIVSFLPKVNLELKASPARFKGNTHPIECISWHEAVEFCNRLSCYTGREYRLPSEAEWEYACRAGTTTPFHFGETIRTDEANYHGEYPYDRGPKGRYRHSTTPVNEFSCANEFGLSDMHGNIFEWCQDIWHENYVEAPLDERAWIEEGDHASRVIRGGSWSSDPIVCRSAYRYQAESDSRNDGLGFRIVVSIPR